jgi:16S rRNA (guanine527-N7)-methyltransferase
VAPLVVLAELASPLLERGGVLVAWKGGREVEEEEALEGLGADLAMELDRVVPVQPFPSSRERHLYLLRKTAGTPDRLPRRPGMARKRPLAR